VPSIEPLPAFDLYAELGVQRLADADAVESAWRAAMRRDHPDIAGAPAATARAARLNVARDWLVDPVRRTRYDAVRWPTRLSATPAVVLSPIDPLGSWPARRRRTAPTAATMASLALMVVLFSILLGPG
jgi:curved DNA-binding protein CbpA